MTTLKDLFRAQTHVELVNWIATTYGLGNPNDASNPHRARRAEMQTRVRLYKDDGAADFAAVIDMVFVKPKVREQRKKLIPVAIEQNTSAKIVDEVASLYDRPAVRTLKDAEKQDAFNAEVKRLHLHEITQQYHRMLYLCHDVLVWQYKGSNGETRLRVVTPDTFDAIPDPNDPLAMAGVLIDTAPVTIRPNRDQLPHYQLWDDTYLYYLSAAGTLVDINGQPASDPIEHKMGRIPGVLLHRSEPTDLLLDPRPGRDITAAHLGIGLLNIMMMRLAKSQGEQQPTLSGPAAKTAIDQDLDGESPMFLPPETKAEMLNMVTHPEHYLSLKRDKITSVGLRHGLSLETLMMSETGDTASGKTFQARRAKLIELRGEQLLRAPTNEGEVVTLIGFDADGMTTDHQEQAIPLDANEEVALLDAKMRKGLDNPVAYLMRKDPDLTETMALEKLKKNLFFWSYLIVSIRALNIPANETNDKADFAKPGTQQLGEETGVGASPQQNGAAGGARADGGNDGKATPQIGAKPSDAAA